MGFRDDIDAITEYLPPSPERQTFLFSATVSRAIQQVARTTLEKNHIFINTVSDTDSPVHENVPQYHTILPTPAEQIPHTLRLLAHDQLVNTGRSKVVLFLPTTKMTQLFSTLVRELSKTILPAGQRTKVYEIHSKRTQEARTLASDAFRRDTSGSSILVTSDVSARGIDYPGVTRVIQIGIPGSKEQYIHRIGRTGRAGTQGRGDLVLLPWECGFVTWQLTEMALRPLTINELKSQVRDLAAKFDSDPNEFYQGVNVASPSAPRFDRGGRVQAHAPTMYSTPVSPKISGMDRAISELLQNVDEEAVKETFASLLGYYIAKCHELRTQKSVVVQGCKDWTVQALHLPVPPYVSDAFLHRLGYTDGRTKRFGSSEVPTQAPRTGSSWMGRGRQGNKGREVRPAWANEGGDLDENDPAGNPEEYRSYRYGNVSKSFNDTPRQREFRSDYGMRGGGGGERNGNSFGQRNDAGERGYGMRGR